MMLNRATSIITFFVVLLFWFEPSVEGFHLFESKTFRRYNRRNGFRLNDIPAESAPVDQDFQNYIKGTTPWKGRRDILKRRRQVPDPSYSPQQVVSKCLEALQVNDDPQLDHGCCVLLEFKSPEGPLAEGKLDPAEYARFLRTTKYAPLLDHSQSELLGDPQQLQDSLSVKQRVKVKAWAAENALETAYFDFYLSRLDETWLIDVVLLSNDRR